VSSSETVLTISETIVYEHWRNLALLPGLYRYWR
jgi:hypothetical protein